MLTNGYHVVGISRSAGAIKSDKLIDLQADLSKKENLQVAVKEIKQKYPVFDVLIFAAGMLTAHDIDNLNYSDMEYQYKVNVFAPMFIESQLLKNIKVNSTYVVNVTSSALIDYYPRYSEYSSSKAALAKFTADLQKSLLETGARVMDVCPGGFKSNIYKTMTGDKIDRDESKQMNAEDLAGLIAFILEMPKDIEIPYLYIKNHRVDE
jgi:short-subunit dehydrogenase